MRAPRLVTSTVLASVVLLAPLVASAAPSPATVGRMPGVPASAGTLVPGPIHYTWPAGHRAAGTSQTATVDQSNDLHYAGGAAEPGAVATKPELYIVFWGSQWDKTDPAADYLTKFFQGLYGPGDDWTSVVSQYCEGVAAGTITCPSSAPHVGGPDGSLVKGVWFDDAQPAVPFSALVNVQGQCVPATTTCVAIDQMGGEAVRAAEHFGKTAPASNAQAIYLIALPSKFLSPGEGYYCGYHRSIQSNYGDVAFINLPYVADLGSLCFQNAVNANGPYDGFSIIGGHEYLEAVTDMRPVAGWVDAQGSENADKCQGITSGQGAMANLTLSTGTFAVQSTWSNEFNGGAGGCVLHNS